MRINRIKITLCSIVLVAVAGCGSDGGEPDVGASSDLPLIEDTSTSTDTAPVQDNQSVNDPGQEVQEVQEDAAPTAELPVVQDQSSEPDVPAFSCGSEPDGTPCDDGNPATINDACYSGVCSGELSPEGWHYEFQGEIQGRFSKLRIKQTMEPDVDESWTPWITTSADWSINYMNSGGPPGFYPAYNIQVINECATPEQTSAFINAQLWDWYSIDATFAKDGWLILQNEKGEEELRLQAWEVKWTSYMPEFGSCFSEEALEFETTKLVVAPTE